jgi:hypothetical protein
VSDILSDNAGDGTALASRTCRWANDALVASNRKRRPSPQREVTSSYPDREGEARHGKNPGHSFRRRNEEQNGIVLAILPGQKLLPVLPSAEKQKVKYI